MGLAGYITLGVFGVILFGTLIYGTWWDKNNPQGKKDDKEDK